MNCPFVYTYLKNRFSEIIIFILEIKIELDVVL